MSIFLKTAGAALIMLGLGIGVVILTKPGVLDAMGIRLDTAALLLIGGVLATGQSAIVDAMRSARNIVRATDIAIAPIAVPLPAAGPDSSAMSAAGTLPNAFGRKPEIAAPGMSAEAMRAAAVATVAAAGAGVVGMGMSAKAAAQDPVSDTITALEQAKADVIKSMSGMDATTHAPTPAQAQPQAALVSAHTDEPEELDDASADLEDGLFVIEEKVIRGRQARILSDDTVEAETDEGWMRFENLEHLNEYLDSVEEQAV